MIGKVDEVIVAGNGPSANKLEIAHARSKDALTIDGLHVGLDIINKIGLKINLYYPAEYGQPNKDLPSSIIPHPINFRPVDLNDLGSGVQITFGAAYPDLRQASLCVCLMVAADDPQKGHQPFFVAPPGTGIGNLLPS